MRRKNPRVDLATATGGVRTYQGLIRYTGWGGAGENAVLLVKGINVTLDLISDCLYLSRGAEMDSPQTGRDGRHFIPRFLNDDYGAVFSGTA